MEYGTVTGACRYCGQVYNTQGVTQEEADRIATQVCSCDDARKEKRILEIIQDAQERAEMLSGPDGEADGFTAVDSPEVGDLINRAIERVARGELHEVSMQIIGCGTAKITGKAGGIRITRNMRKQRTEETVWRTNGRPRRRPGRGCCTCSCGPGAGA